MEKRHPFEWRTRVRRHLPWRLINLGVATRAMTANPSVQPGYLARWCIRFGNDDRVTCYCDRRAGLDSTAGDTCRLPRIRPSLRPSGPPLPTNRSIAAVDVVRRVVERPTRIAGRVAVGDQRLRRADRQPGSRSRPRFSKVRGASRGAVWTPNAHSRALCRIAREAACGSPKVPLRRVDSAGRESSRKSPARRSRLGHQDGVIAVVGRSWTFALSTRACRKRFYGRRLSRRACQQ